MSDFEIALVIFGAAALICAIIICVLIRDFLRWRQEKRRANRCSEECGYYIR